MNEEPVDSETLGRRLKIERRRLGLTQKALAEAGGVRRVTVFQYEKGHRRPSLDFLCTIQPIGVSLAFLLFGVRWEPRKTARYIDADLAQELFRLVDRYAVDKKGRALHIDHRDALFSELVSIAINLEKDQVDSAAIHDVLTRFAA